MLASLGVGRWCIRRSEGDAVAGSSLLLPYGEELCHRLDDTVGGSDLSLLHGRCGRP
jgi:hypothetical protein